LFCFGKTPESNLFRLAKKYQIEFLPHRRIQTMFRPALCFASLLMLSASASAIQNNLPTVRAIPESVREGQTFTLEIKGIAPDGCGYIVEKTNVELDVITVRLKDGGFGLGCPTVLTPFVMPVAVFENGRSAQAGTYKVRIEFAQLTASDQIQVKLLAFGLVPVLANAKAAVQPESGNWNFDPNGAHRNSGSGINFNLERQSNVLINLANFYTNEGSSAWYLNAGTLVANTLKADYLNIRGGQSLFGNYQAPSIIAVEGQMLMEFTSPTRGTAWITQPIDEGLVSGLKLMPISIARFNFGYLGADKIYSGKFALVSDGDSAIGSATLNLQPDVSNSVTTQRYSAGVYELVCKTSCMLMRSAVPIGEFTSLGLERLRGLDSVGKAISLIRID
jgi:hypothetical protein